MTQEYYTRKGSETQKLSDEFIISVVRSNIFINEFKPTFYNESFVSSFDSKSVLREQINSKLV